MAQARFYPDRRFDIVDSEPANPGPGEVRVRVGAVGICGSDLHVYRTGQFTTRALTDPLVFGHELAGAIDATGDDALAADGTRLTPGIPVAVEPHIPCHRCRWCRQDDPHLCPHHRFLGVPPTDGALQSTLLLPAGQCFPLPTGMSEETGALLEPLGVAIHATRLGGLRAGQRVGVWGLGNIGLMIARLARLARAGLVLACDPNPGRSRRALSWAEADAINDDPPASPDWAQKYTTGEGLDLAFEAAEGGEAARQAAEALAPGGTLVLIGIPEDDRIWFPHALLRRKEINVLFARRMKHTYPEAIRLTTPPYPAIDLDALVTHRFPLDQVAEAFDQASRAPEDTLKVMIHPNA
ncbi:MAG: alcohol dehydrogenase catalytic domain-containing protein [Opitutales bacterium]